MTGKKKEVERMGRTKKRMLGILMTASMLLGLVPATAYAEESYNIWVDGVKVTSENADAVPVDGGKVSYDADRNILTLKNAKISYTVTDGNCPAAIWSEGSLGIELIGDNKITVEDNSWYGDVYGIYGCGDLILSGGSLDVSVNGDTEEGYAAAVYTEFVGAESELEEVDRWSGNGSIVITDGAELNATAKAFTADAIYAGSSFVLEDGEVNAKADGAEDENGWASAIGGYEIFLGKGKVTAKASAYEGYGIWAQSAYTMKDLSVTAEGNSAALVVDDTNWNALNIPKEIVAVAIDGKEENRTYTDWAELGYYDCLTYFTEDGEIAKKITFQSALKVTVEADEETVKPGDEVLFTITLENMLDEPIGWESERDERFSYIKDLEYYHAFPFIMVKDTMDKRFEEGWFCDADGNRIETILLEGVEFEVEDVVPVCEKDIVTERPEPCMELMAEEEALEVYPTYLYPGEKAELYYMAVVSDDAKKGEAENTVTAKAVIGYEYVPVMAAEDDMTLTDMYEMLNTDGLVSLDVGDSATVTVKVEEESSSHRSSYPDIEVMTEGGDVGVGKKLVIIRPDAGYEIDKVTVNGKEVEVPENGKLTGLRSSDDVKIWFAEKVSAVEQKEIILMINELVAFVFDKYVTNDVAPVIRDGRTMLPARFVVEALDGAVAWDEAARKVTITKEGAVLEIFIGERFATVNGEPVELDAPAFIENDRTYLPIRFVAEYLGANVAWNADAQSVTIIPGE